MTDHEESKHEFSLHQDSLFWSRTETLIAVQSGIFVGIAAFRSEPAIAYSVLGFGVWLTLAIAMLMIRDRLLGSRAFRESGIQRTVINDRGWQWLPTGTTLSFGAVAVLFAADCVGCYLLLREPPSPNPLSRKIDLDRVREVGSFADKIGGIDELTEIIDLIKAAREVTK